MDNIAHGYNMMGGDDGHMYGSAVWGWLFMLVLLAAAIAVIVATVRYMSSREGGRQETALDILDKRYARGEIDKKEHHELKQELTRKEQ
jgi:putative membrane protein